MHIVYIIYAEQQQYIDFLHISATIVCITEGNRGKMRKFDYTFLKDGLIPANLVNIIAGISSLKTMTDVRKAEYMGVFKGLEAVSKERSIKSSNGIEGIFTRPDRIKGIICKKSAPINRIEAEIAGYRDALLEVHSNHALLDFKKNDILSLHKMMMSFTGYKFGGQYKTEDNTIVEIDENGNRVVRFHPTPASETEYAMEQLELAYEKAKDDPDINKLLLIPCVILDFLCIYPFREGNGRMSRLLSLLLLYNNGYDAGKYISFEEQISNNKVNYDEALRRSSMDRDNDDNSYFIFVTDFLSSLNACYQELDKRFVVTDGKRITKKGRIEATVFDSKTPLSKADICQMLPDISPTTVEAVLGVMVRDGRIERIGQGKATRYIKQK
jgi:Fic family protein